MQQRDVPSCQHRHQHGGVAEAARDLDRLPAERERLLLVATEMQHLAQAREHPRAHAAVAVGKPRERPLEQLPDLVVGLRVPVPMREPEGGPRERLGRSDALGVGGRAPQGGVGLGVAGAPLCPP